MLMRTELAVTIRDELRTGMSLIIFLPPFLDCAMIPAAI
jgi:hypothetical protein